jgi:FkbM family methyltransferase
VNLLLKKIIGFIGRELLAIQEDGIGFKVIKKKKNLKKLGVNYSRFKLFDKKWFLDLEINTIIDIGANIGEFTLIFSELFPNAKIHAFEPLPECFAQLEKRTKSFKNIYVYNIALGNKKEVKNIFQSSWHPASSFKSMTIEHKKNYPKSAINTEIPVFVEKLDEVSFNSDIKNNIFIKIDVQGFEDEVIKGGILLFKKAKVIVIEVSFLDLYKDEPQFHGIYSLLSSLEFEYKGSLKQSMSKDKSFLQADCVFVNKN